MDPRFPQSSLHKHLRKSLRKTSTRTEAILWNQLRYQNLGFKFRRQVSIGRYVVDFRCFSKMLIIEIDGSVHLLKENSANDAVRQQYLEGKGFHIIRFSDTQTEYQLDQVLLVIKTFLYSLPSSSEIDSMGMAFTPPSGRGRGRGARG